MITGYRKLRETSIVEMLRPCEDLQGVDPYFPFHASEYSHGTKLDYTKVSTCDIDKFTSESVSVPCNVREPSKLRNNGLDIWDRSAIIPKCIWHKVVEDDRLAQPVKSKSLNDFMRTSILPSINLITPIEGGGWVRPLHKYIMDLPSFSCDGFDGYDVLCMGSVMAQHETIHVPNGPNLYERTRTWIARIHVASVLGLPVFSGEWDWYSSGDMFPPHGIIVSTGRSARNPYVSIPIDGPGSPVPDKTILVVGVGIDTGPPPSGFIYGSGDVNKFTVFSCAPMTSVISGWEFVDVVTHMPMNRRSMRYVLRWEDMLPPDILDVGGCVDSPIRDFITSREYLGMYNSAMSYPPPKGLNPPRIPDMGLVRPVTREPADPDRSNMLHQPWFEYWDKLDRIRNLVRTSSESIERGRRVSGSPGIVPTAVSRKTRDSNYNKVVKLIKSRDHSLKRVRTYTKRGMITKAAECAEKAEVCSKSIEAITSL